MSFTRGGPNKAKRFAWQYLAAERAVIIINEDGRNLSYTLGQIVAVLERLEREFGAKEFPLGNNVAKLGDGTEQPGLGMTLLAIKPGDTTFAQGASYLGVVLEELGYLRWNGYHRGIAWRLTVSQVTRSVLESRLLERKPTP